MSRIGIIREVIERHGGSSDVTYYADNTKHQMKGNTTDSGDAVYKIERGTDGLGSDANRRKVLDELNKHPEVKRTYLSRPQTIPYGYDRGHISGPHIKVVFHGISDVVKRATVVRRKNAEKKRKLQLKYGF